MLPNLPLSYQAFSPPQKFSQTRAFINAIHSTSSWQSALMKRLREMLHANFDFIDRQRIWIFDTVICNNNLKFILYNFNGTHFGVSKFIKYSIFWYVQQIRQLQIIMNILMISNYWVVKNRHKNINEIICIWIFSKLWKICTNDRN